MSASATPLIFALETLARAARVDIERSTLERKRDACLSSRAPTHDWEKSIVHVGEVIGLRVRALELTIHDLLRGPTDEVMPIVRIVEHEGKTSCVHVLGRETRGLRVKFDDEPSILTLDEASLVALLGHPSGFALTWMTADPATSIGTLTHGDGEDSHEHMSPSARLLSMVKLERDDLWVIITYAAGIGILSLATPLGVQFIVNNVAFGALLQPLVVLTLLVLTGLVLEGVLQALQYWVIERIQQRIFVRTSLDVAFRLPRMHDRVLDELHPPELVNRFFDVVTLQKGAATVLSEGVAIALHSMMGMLILAFYHPFLLAFDVVLVLGLLLVIFVVGRGATKTAIDESEGKYAVAGWLEEAAKHRTSLSLGDGPSYVSARAESLTRDWLHRRKRHWKIVFRQHSTSLALRAFSSAALLGLGGWLVLSRQLSLGQLVAAELIVGAVAAGFAKLGKSFESYYDLLAAADKIGHLVDLPLRRSEGVGLAESVAGLDLDARDLRIVRGDSVLATVDLRLLAGSRTVIFAKDGSGKSTLVDVLTGMREVTGGQLVADGTPLADVATTALGAEVAVVRRAEIFEGTIFDNVAMGRSFVGRDEARKALRAVGLERLYDDYPLGLDTPLPSDAQFLGKSAAILLTIARAVAGNPRLLVLDGAFDALGDAARSAAWKGIADRPWTILVTTSHRELVELGDASYVLANHRLDRIDRDRARPPSSKRSETVTES